jgi:hypothetical protein
MLRVFEATVSALCYSILQERCRARVDGDDFRHNEVVRFVRAQQRRMPDYLRWPLFILTLVFDWSGCLRGQGRFHRQEHARRWRQIEAWRRSRLGCCRDLVRFYESLVVLCWFSETDRHERMDAMDGRPGASAALAGARAG